MQIELNNVVKLDGEQFLVTSLVNGVHGVRVTDEELRDGEDLGGRNRVFLAADADELEAKGAQVFSL